MVYYMQGFDEFMNVVMDDAEEVIMKEQTRRQIGCYGNTGWWLV